MISTACPSHVHAVKSMPEARSIVALMIATLSAETCAAIAAAVAGQSGGDCPAAAVAAHLSAAAWRELGPPEIPPIAELMPTTRRWRKVKPCGTGAAYRRHLRHGMKYAAIDDKCKRWHRADVTRKGR